MSVKASDRKPSKMQFEVLSNEVRDDVSRVLTNKRLVEPKWKYIIAVPGVQMAEQICWYIKAANFIWPKDETALMARRADGNRRSAAHTSPQENQRRTAKAEKAAPLVG